MGRRYSNPRYTATMEPFVHDAVLDMHMARAELMSALAEVGPGDWGRDAPYGARTLHDLLAHVAGADRAWALAAQGLPARRRGSRAAAVAGRGEGRASARSTAAAPARPAELIEEMEQRRNLLLGLYDLLGRGISPRRCDRTAISTTPSESASGSGITTVCTPRMSVAHCA